MKKTFGIILFLITFLLILPAISLANQYNTMGAVDGRTTPLNSKRSFRGGRFLAWEDPALTKIYLRLKSERGQYESKARTSRSNKSILERREQALSYREVFSQNLPGTEQKATVKVRIGRVREKPSFDSAIKYRLKKGNSVSVIKTKDDWYLVELDDGRTGWAHRSLFFKTPQTQESSPGIMKEVKEIRFEITREGEERATILLNGFFLPHIFAIERDRPRVFCVFLDTRLGDNIPHRIKVDGSMIQQIRVELYDDPICKVEVSLDLVPRQKYEVQPKASKDENLYTIIVRRKP